jgi:thymidylate kinase
MNICIEGTDCVGKSFIIEKLIEWKKLNFAIIPEKEWKHLIKFDEQKDLWTYFVAGYNLMVVSILLSCDNWIKHRLHLSEYAYCKLLDRKTIFGFEQIDKVLFESKNKTLLILLEVDYDTYCKRMISKNAKERMWVKDEFEKTTNLFKEAYNLSKLDKILIDATKPIENIMEEIKHFYESKL